MEGVIIKGIAGFYYVRVDQRVMECKARGVFRNRSQTPMVGDRVVVEPLDELTGTIVEILERSTELVRPFVANVSQAYVVFALKNPDINHELMQKFLVMLEHNGIHPVLVFNKSDLVESSRMEELRRIFLGTGYPLHFVSVKEGRGMEPLFDALAGEITVLCGPSGAGKSTLLNKLSGAQHMETGEISRKLGRGKHTTRHSELIALAGGFLVDTPGFSTMELVMDPLELKEAFPEFVPHAAQCRFNGCNHYKEPGCRVKDQVGKDISKERYAFYTKFYNELMEERKRKW